MKDPTMAIKLLKGYKYLVLIFFVSKVFNNNAVYLLFKTDAQNAYGLFCIS